MPSFKPWDGGCRNALEDPWVEPDDSMFTRSVSPEEAPDKATYVEIDYEKGDPVAINGDSLSPASLLTALNKVQSAPFPVKSSGHEQAGENFKLFSSPLHDQSTNLTDPSGLGKIGSYFPPDHVGPCLQHNDGSRPN